MSVWILADTHVGQDPESDVELHRLLDRAAKRRVELVFLGDLFRAWIGIASTWSMEEALFIDQLKRVERAGSLRFVVGNRDYLVDRAGFRQVVTGHGGLLLISGIPTWVTHGHLLDSADRLFHIWHRLSRRGLRTGRFALERLPGPLCRRIVGGMEQALRSTNQGYKSTHLPLPALQALARKASGRGASRAVVGHFHVEPRTLFADDPAAVPLTVAPSWLDQREILVAEGPELRPWRPFD